MGLGSNFRVLGGFRESFRRIFGGFCEGFGGFGRVLEGFWSVLEGLRVF